MEYVEEDEVVALWEISPKRIRFFQKPSNGHKHGKKYLRQWSLKELTNDGFL